MQTLTYLSFPVIQYYEQPLYGVTYNIWSYTQIDTTCDGLINWNQFCSYLLMQFQDKDKLMYGRPVPFQSQVKLRHNLYNKVCLSVPPPHTMYVTVSK